MATLKVTCHDCGKVEYQNKCRCNCGSLNTTVVSDEEDLAAYMDPRPCPLGEARARRADREAAGDYRYRR